MKKGIKSLCLPILIAAFVLSGSIAASGQARERFGISARAGGINAVTGRTIFHGKGESDWQQLSITEDLQAGDVVRTESDGRVEMLLSPGSYLRVGENSEFELTDNSLDKLEVRVMKGTAIVEAAGTDNSELLINITTPHAKMSIVRRGLYRVNVVPGDATELIVRKGRVLLADSQTKVKGGSKVIFSANNFSVAKLEKADKKKMDGLESWSKQRAELVAKANSRLTSRDVLLASFNSGFMDGSWWSNAFAAGASGIWVYAHRYNCYTFVPFHYGWGSPYSGTYTNAFSNGYNGRPVYTGSGPVNGSSAGSTWPSSGSTGPSGVPHNTPPSSAPSAPARDMDSSPMLRSKPDISPDGGRSRPLQP